MGVSPSGLSTHYPSSKIIPGGSLGCSCSASVSSLRKVSSVEWRRSFEQVSARGKYGALVRGAPCGFRSGTSTSLDITNVVVAITTRNFSNWHSHTHTIAPTGIKNATITVTTIAIGGTSPSLRASRRCLLYQLREFGAVHAPSLGVLLGPLLRESRRISRHGIGTVSRDYYGGDQIYHARMPGRVKEEACAAQRRAPHEGGAYRTTNCTTQHKFSHLIKVRPCIVITMLSTRCRYDCDNERAVIVCGQCWHKCNIVLAKSGTRSQRGGACQRATFLRQFRSCRELSCRG